MVREYGERRGLPFAILRPGTVFGPGKTDLTGRIGINTFGFFIHVGGSNLLPLTFVDNCAEAIVLAGLVPGVVNETFNVVDDDPLTSAQFLAAYRKHVAPFFRCVCPTGSPTPSARPGSPIRGARRASSAGVQSPSLCRRVEGNRFPNRKLRDSLGWTPKVPMDAAMARFLSQFPALEGKP